MNDLDWIRPNVTDLAVHYNRQLMDQRKSYPVSTKNV